MSCRATAVSFLLFFLATIAAVAQEPPPPEPARYRVTLNVPAGVDALPLVGDLVKTYGLVDAAHSNGADSFTADLDPVGIGRLREDRRVRSVERMAAGRRNNLQTAPLGGRLAKVATDDETIWSLGPYAYDGAGNIKSIARSPSFTDRYVYDGLSRVVTGTAGSAARHQAYSYDSFGNILSIVTDGNTSGAIHLGVNRAKNQLAVDVPGTNAWGAYDASGNMISTNLGDTYQYDALGMVTRSTISSHSKVYLYTPADERIAEISHSGTVRGTTSWAIRGEAGAVLRRFTQSASNVWSWDQDYIYQGGKLLAAELPSNELRRHFVLDHLGTPRLITDDSGSVLSAHEYYPFGREASTTMSSERLKFTGHERDTPTLDYMHARYYDNGWGRFLSVDPVIDVRNAIRRPQMWNRYAYALNNPVRYTDPDGRLVRLEGTQEDQQKLLDLIRQNLLQKDRSLVSLGKNGMLQIAGNAKGSSIAFTMLKSAIQNKSQTIDVGFAQATLVKPGAGPVRPVQVDLQNTGGGLTTGASYTMSGKIEVRVDPRGNPEGEPLSIVMGHELLGHGWDLMYKGTSSEHSARNTENLIRLSLGLTPRPNQINGPWQDDEEH